MKAHSVAELPGLYGPITVSELLLQKIWAQREFSQDHLATNEGQSLEIIHPGRWNRQEGPDFRGAELKIGGEIRRGDVEVHFHMKDWAAHGHGTNPEFRDVVLHVVLFPPQSLASPAMTEGVNAIPVFVLLPHLLHDIEEYANLDSLGAFEEIMARAAVWLEYPEHERRARLREKALTRWNQKVRFASSRLESSSWEAVCHQYAMEVLGYRRNRAPMSNLATRFPLDRFAQGELTPDALFTAVTGWKLAGLRPANHPRHRLVQYLQWTAAAPNWPLRMRTYSWEDSMSDSAMSTAAFRSAHRLTEKRCMLADKLTGGALSGSRLDTLVCDALLPLLAAVTNNPAHFEPYWLHWFGGDVPDAYGEFLRASCLLPSRDYPKSNGLLQGVLQVFLEQPVCG
ncbi:MAG: DUF2851 family protein [Verrucomicrobiota bacterium]|nr:DUF2851 family protein [Verrucomicrobiota bacterium]